MYITETLSFPSPTEAGSACELKGDLFQYVLLSMIRILLLAVRMLFFIIINVSVGTLLPSIVLMEQFTLTLTVLILMLQVDVSVHVNNDGNSARC